MLATPKVWDPHAPIPSSVYLFGTCLVDLIYPQAGLAAVELIEREGVQVIYPPEQTCCGQPAFNSGFFRQAQSVAREQLRWFTRPLPVVVPSGSCGAMLQRQYAQLFAETEAAARAKDFAARVVEWSGFIDRVLSPQWEDRGPPLRVAYHPSCHLLRELGEREAPMRLLQRLRQVELVPIADAEECCGFGGTFSVKQAELSAAMVLDKCRAIVESGAEMLVSMDSGCLMHLQGALMRMGASLSCKPLPLFLRERVL